MTLLSIVIPCYNSGATLEEAVTSALAQANPTVGLAVEVIVVNDGSSDPDTLTALEKLPSSVQVVNQENAGLPAARNAGLSLAKGDFLLPLDADDWLDRRFATTAVQLMQDDPSIGFVFAALDLFGEAEGVLVKRYNPFDQLFLNQLPYCLCYRRSTWETNGPYDETMRDGYEDWEFNVRLGAKGIAGHAIPEPMFHYRVAASGMLQAKSRKLHSQLWRSIQDRHPERYRLPSLVRAWRRHGATAYPAALFFGLWAVHRLLPAQGFNRLFTWLLSRSHSARVQ
ncbi:MAG: glycosyltransferase family 2 protein [Magnetovibrionaceae bacterium]